MIEDDKTLLENTATFLQMKEYEVFTARSGREGIDAALQQMPDLIICDIMMPGLDGYEVLKTLRNISHTAVTPFIFLTAKAEKPDFRKGMQLGADDYISKPFDFNDLVNAIEMRLEKAETLIQTGAEHYLSIIDQSPMAIFIYLNNMFFLTNNRLREILGYDKEELEKMNVTDLVDPPDLDQFIHEVSERLEEKHKPAACYIKMRNKAQEPVPLSLMMTPFRVKLSTALLCFASEKQPDDPGKENSFAEDAARHLAKSRYFESKYMAGSVKLSVRELEVLSQLSHGLNTAEIADKLFISPRTVEFHRANLLSKTGCKNMIELVTFAIKNRIVEV